MCENLWDPWQGSCVLEAILTFCPALTMPVFAGREQKNMPDSCVPGSWAASLVLTP